MATYLIDYENIKNGALNGISLLEETDRIILFYSENANRMTFDLHRRLSTAKAVVEYREVPVGGHNALDFQLSTYLGYLLANDKESPFVIISSDRGFEYVANFWRKEGYRIGVLSYLKDPVSALQQIRPAQEGAGATAEAADEATDTAVPDVTVPIDVAIPVKAEKPAKDEARKKRPSAQTVKAVRISVDTDLHALLGDAVSEEEFQFVEGAVEKYKTKLGLNNALVKKFGNQKAGEFYQKLKPLLSGKKGR